MPEKPWKRAERQVAKRLGGERVKRQGERAPDVVTPYLVADVKMRKRLPRWITDAIFRIRSLHGPRKMRILILEEEGFPYTLVVMELTDFKQWFGPIAAHKQEVIDEGKRLP